MQGNGEQDSFGAEDIEALNDRLATEHPIDDYYARSPWPIRFTESRRLSIIREMVGRHEDLDVLEIGVGGGHVLEMFGGARCTAVDVSDVYLELAKRRLAGREVRFLKGEVQELPLSPASFDRIICTEVLEHTQDPDAILASIARLLEPAGVAVITIPNERLIDRVKGAIRATRLDRALGLRIDWGGDAHHFQSWTDGEFRTLLSRHLRITARRAAPFGLLPLRLCYRCVRKEDAGPPLTPP